MQQIKSQLRCSLFFAWHPKNYWSVCCLFFALLVSTSAWSACPEDSGQGTAIESEFLRVITLNIAHGRKDGRNQMFLKDEVIRNNLVEVAAGIGEANAHVIALQEADAPSAWSGKFDHVELFAKESGYPCFFHGIHATNRYYAFGTALLAQRPFEGAFSYSFKPSRPTTNKGFVTAAIDWNPAGALDEPLRVIAVSVHLDFSRRSVRRSQIDEMAKMLSKIEGPMVLMGDFNTDWQTEDSSLKYLAEQLNLTVFEPHADGLSTYGDKGARLDWILISSELEFSRYAVVPKVMSDHFAVGADIVLKESGSKGRQDQDNVAGE